MCLSGLVGSLPYNIKHLEATVVVNRCCTNKMGVAVKLGSSAGVKCFSYVCFEKQRACGIIVP